MGNNLMKRDAGIDTLAGFFVLYIAVGHALNLYHIPAYNLCPSPFLYFFMPWFFYKGGMYFKYKDDKSAFIQNAKRLLKPFVLWTIIGCLFFNVLALLFKTQTHTPLVWVKELIAEGSLYENKPLWFLLSLFLVRTLSNKIIFSKKMCYVAIIAGVLIATFSNLVGFHIPLWFYNSSSGGVFFLIGFLYGRRYTWHLFVLSLVIWLTISVFMPIGVNMRANETNYGIFGLWWIYSVAGIYSFNYLIRFFPLTVLNSKYNLLRVAGIYSMEIYVIHWIILLIPIAMGIV